MTTNSQERLWRISEALKFIPTNETIKKEVVGKIMAAFGVSSRVAQEYIEVLIVQGFVRGGKTLWRVETK